MLNGVKIEEKNTNERTKDGTEYNDFYIACSNTSFLKRPTKTTIIHPLALLVCFGSFILLLMKV